jgi:integrase
VSSSTWDKRRAVLHRCVGFAVDSGCGHLAEFGAAPDGRLFPAQRTGAAVRASVYTRLQQARVIALSPEQVASPLARRPYDLRHAALSSWLNAGVPPTEVAERAGHTVAVLLSVYAKCLHGERATYNARIDALLGESP